VVAAADLNNDGHEDALYAIEKKVVAVDVYNQVLLWTIGDFSSAVTDIVPCDFDDNGVQEIIVATSSQLSIWKKNGSSYLEQASINIGCVQIAAGNVDGVSGIEIVCSLKEDYYYENNGKVAIYNAALQEQKQFELSGKITDFILTGAANGKQDLLVGFQRGDDYYARYDVIPSIIAQISSETGAIIWESPNLLGPVSSHSLHLFTDADGRQRLTFATYDAMYITR
jgi:hypothetical protein